MSDNKEHLNFIEEIIEEDLQEGKHNGHIHTRFPPEPNGYLHIGHVKAITINFELAKKYGGSTNLRFDDTNPTTEETEYVEGIKRDIQWLGYTWNGDALYASDYFDKLYHYAEKLILDGHAYIDDSTAEQIAEMKKTPMEAGIESPYRNRPVDENLDLFRKMKAGAFPDGTRVLRAKVDMTSPNMHMRDPVIYRIKHDHHHRTGDQWCIYPMYDFAHGQSDSIEGITHSLCSLEFTHHRPLYDWFIEKLGIFPSRQIEFARMNVTYLITSKRKLLKLVEEGIVTGWDDPRMPTIAGMRRRGYPAAALREFCEKVGVAKRDNLIEIELLESCVRDELNKTSDRAMVVMDPIRITLRNYEENKTEYLTAENNPEDATRGERTMSFSRHLFIERDDFMENPPKNYFRLYPGGNVRLKNAYIISCEEIIKDESGEVTELICSYHPDSKSGNDTSGLKVKGTLHWVNAADAIEAEIREYDKLFTDPTPAGHDDKDVLDFINPNSLVINRKARLESSLSKAKPGQAFQFLRKGYYTADDEFTLEHPVFNATVNLKESFKVQK
ncbi:MAG: glutamine--tRNA ligase/YqeY domain fusion protein [Saprospiraceae bacterium]|nr:glutamine--tRNA ligase/YqeY domain fusion protein [Saprospiraceae bacterium]